MEIKKIMESSPFIVVGMHRSGTTLVSQILERHGVFMGKEQTGNRESVFFQNLNKEVLDVMGVSWRSLDFLPSSDAMEKGLEWARRILNLRLESGLMPGHFGEENQGKRDKNFLWGWKDPRTSLLLPVWRDLFPKAKVVHIIRDGRDASRSLLVREMKREKDSGFYTHDELARRYIAGIQLWKEYVVRVGESLGKFEVSHVMKYENLLKNPIEEIESMLLKLSAGNRNKKSVEESAAFVDPHRKNKTSTLDLSWLDTLAFDRTYLRECGYEN